MDTIVYPLEIKSYRPSSDLWIEANSSLNGFLAEIDLNLEFIGECPSSAVERKDFKESFKVPAEFHCVDDGKCISLVREIKKLSKSEIFQGHRKNVFKSLVIEIVRQLNKRIASIKHSSPFLPNCGGKLAFAHYVTAIVLLYGQISDVVDNDNSYQYHRNEALKHNRNCLRIWSLPKEL